MGVARVYKVGTPFNAIELAEVDVEQTADLMYLAHIDHDPVRLTRYGHTNWAFATVTFGPTVAAPTGVSAVATTPNTDADNDGAAYFPQPATYVVTAINDDTGQESRASTGATVSNDLTLKRNKNTISWSAVTGASRYKVYKAENTSDVGYIGTTEGVTFVDDNIGPDLTDGPPRGDNPFTGDGNKPSTVAFHEQRLMWARTRNRPNGIWGSNSADFENMDQSRPLKDDDALSLALVGSRVNAVNQLVSMSDLLALGSDGVFRINGGDSAGGYLSPTKIVSRRQSGRGSSRLNPIIVDETTFFRPNVGDSIRAIGFTFEIDGYKSNDVAIFSPHLFKGFDIVQWAYAQEPLSCIWAVRSDGKLLCFTWEAEQQVWGWTICETDGVVESIASIPEDGEDRVYLVVRRSVGGAPVRFIERMTTTHWEAIEDAIYLDCANTYLFDTPTAVLGSLWHLEGRTVSALVDGSVVEGLVVQNGRVTLDHAVTRASVGLPYVATIETLPLSFQTGEGTNQGKTTQLGKVVLQVVRSRGILAGPDEDHLYEIKTRSDEAYGEPVGLVTGLMEADMAPVARETATVVVQQPYPLPMTLTACYLDPQVKSV